jgi:thioredoxin-related protein
VLNKEVNIKKAKAVLLITALLFSFLSFSQEKEAINWISFDKAVELAQKNHKHIIVDVFTQWCGPCKLMSKNTFENPQIAQYINEHYYAVKFDAENFDTLKFSMNVPDTVKDKKGKAIKIQTKKQPVMFINPAPKGTPRSPHQFASSILDGQLSYPSIVFLNDKIQRIDVVKGYHTPQQFEPIIKFIGSSLYLKTKYDQYLKTFKPDIK